MPENVAAVVAEWLRRLTRNQIPSGSAGSNPADCVNYFDLIAWRIVKLLQPVDKHDESSLFFI